MKKSTAITIVVVSMVLFGAGCTQPQSPQASVPSLTVPAPSTSSTENGLKEYKGDGFTLLIPADWKESGPGTISSPNDEISIVGGAWHLDRTKLYPDDTRLRALLKAGKLLEVEREIVKSRCEETDSCGTIISSKEIPFKNGKAIEFTVRYQGVSMEHPKQGYINEYHQAYFTENELYEFWTSEMVAPKELQTKYPLVNPSPSEKLEEILKTADFTLK